jgi:hypothetical protein
MYVSPSINSPTDTHVAGSVTVLSSLHVDSLRNIAIENAQGTRTMLLEADMVLPRCVQNFFADGVVDDLEYSPKLLPPKFPGRCGPDYHHQVCDCQSDDQAGPYCSRASYCGSSAAHRETQQLAYNCNGVGIECPQRADGRCRMGWIVPTYRAVVKKYVVVIVPSHTMIHDDHDKCLAGGLI